MQGSFGMSAAIAVSLGTCRLDDGLPSAQTVFGSPVPPLEFGRTMTPSPPVSRFPDPKAPSFQPDLFDTRDDDAPGHAPAKAVMAAVSSLEESTDDDLLEALPRAGVSNVDALCSEVVARSLLAAVPALETLWQRFAGFDPDKPHCQQLAVLNTLARLDGATSQAALKRIVLSRTLPGSLLSVALQGAVQAGLALPAMFVETLLRHEETTVRRAAFSLALRSAVSIDRLREGLQDPTDGIRRLAGIALGIRGDAQARRTLLLELSCSPSPEVIEAITAVWDDDVIVHLGRCAHRHPRLARAVLDALHDIGTRRALNVAGKLQVATRD